MTIPPQLNAHTYEHTHTHTHIKKTHTVGICLYYTTRNPWSGRRGYRDNKSPAPLQTSGASPFVPCISSSFIPPVVTKFAHGLSGTTQSEVQEVCDFPSNCLFPHVFFNQGFLPDNPEGASYFSSLLICLICFCVSFSIRRMMSSQLNSI